MPEPARQAEQPQAPQAEQPQAQAAAVQATLPVQSAAEPAPAPCGAAEANAELPAVAEPVTTAAAKQPVTTAAAGPAPVEPSPTNEPAAALRSTECATHTAALPAAAPAAPTVDSGRGGSHLQPTTVAGEPSSTPFALFAAGLVLAALLLQHATH